MKDSQGSPLLLALETATSRPSVALVRGGMVVSALRGDGSCEHAEALLPLIDQCLGAASAPLAEVEAFAIAIGPGSFTSLRIGVATLKGLAFGSELPVATVSTLATLATHASVPSERGAWCVPLLDARMGEAYAAAFRPVLTGRGGTEGASTIPRTGTPEASVIPGWQVAVPEGVYSPTELAARLKAPVVLAGDDAALFADSLREAGAEVLEGSGREQPEPLAVSVARLGAVELSAGRGLPVAEVAPKYARRAQAEVLRTGQRFTS